MQTEEGLTRVQTPKTNGKPLVIYVSTCYSTLTMELTKEVCSYSTYEIEVHEAFIQRDLFKNRQVRKQAQHGHPSNRREVFVLLGKSNQYHFYITLLVL